MPDIKTVIFDLGGVLVDWNPDYVYTPEYFESPEKREYFFKNVCTPDWNENQDAGYPIAIATEEKLKEFPEWEQPIRDFYGRWVEMLGGPIEESVELFRQLKQNKQLRFYALTNWSAETFPIALERFDFLKWFDGILVSGEEKIRKPFPEFYQLLVDKFHVDLASAVFIDDNLRNLQAGESLGIRSIHFQSPAQLKEELQKLGLAVK